MKSFTILLIILLLSACCTTVEPIPFNIGPELMTPPPTLRHL